MAMVPIDKVSQVSQV